MWDGLITWYEAAILMVLFTAYFTLLFLNDALLRFYNKIKFSRKVSKLTPEMSKSLNFYNNYLTY